MHEELRAVKGSEDLDIKELGSHSYEAIHNFKIQHNSRSRKNTLLESNVKELESCQRERVRIKLGTWYRTKRNTQITIWKCAPPEI